jgi:hypothetical protein
LRAKVWKILICEWILLLEIQTNYKNWVWKEKINWAFNEFTLGPTAQATLVLIVTTHCISIQLSQWPCMLLQSTLFFPLFGEFF